MFWLCGGLVHGVGTLKRVLEAGLGLGVELVTALDVAVGRGCGIEDVEVDPVRSFVVRIGDDGIRELIIRGGDAVEVDGHVVVWLERALGVGATLSWEKGVVADVAEAGCFGARYCRPPSSSLR